LTLRDDDLECVGPIARYRLLIKQALPAQCIFKTLGRLVDQDGVVIGALDGRLRGAPWPGALAVHVDKCRRVAKVDDNCGTGAHVSCQLPREAPIVPYLVHIRHLVPTKRRCRRHSVVRQPLRSDRVGWKRLKHQARWSRFVRCRTALMRHPSSALAMR
jgi:hypothetical protein